MKLSATTIGKPPIIAAVVLLTTLSAWSKELVIAKDGKSNYQIVLASKMPNKQISNRLKQVARLSSTKPRFNNLKKGKMMSSNIDLTKKMTAKLLLKWCQGLRPLFAEDGALELDRKSCFEEFQIEKYEGPLTYNQFTHLAHLILSEGIAGDADEKEKELLRKTGLANIQYNLDQINEKFEHSLFTMGKYLGHKVDNWSTYYLLRSFQIVEENKLGSDKFRSEFKTKLLGSCEAVFEKYSEKVKTLQPEDFNKHIGTSVNHFSWHMLLLYAAGTYFENNEWKELGFSVMKKLILPFQDEFGCWSEGGGIVVGYSMVTAQAISSFAEMSGDKEALEAVLKYVDFCSTFSFPDGTNSVCADCRMTYSTEPMLFLPASFLRSEIGNQICQRRIKTKLNLDNYNTIGGRAQGLGFFSEFALLLHTKEFAPKNIGINKEQMDKLPVRKLKNSPWTAFLSTQLTEEQPGRYALDSQNFIEVMHNEKGYLIGGGNSKYLPRFSTVRRKTRGRPYIPTKAELIKSDESSVEAAYYYDNDRIEVKVDLGKECRISFKITHKEYADDIYEGALFLSLKKDESLTQDGAEMIVDPDGKYKFKFKREKGPVEWRGLKFSVSGKAALSYPIPPYNPYRLNTLPGKSKYCARLSFDIPEEGIEIIISE